MPPFQGGDTGSNPVGATKYTRIKIGKDMTDLDWGVLGGHLGAIISYGFVLNEVPTLGQ